MKSTQNLPTRLGASRIPTVRTASRPPGPGSLSGCREVVELRDSSPASGPWGQLSTPAEVSPGTDGRPRVAGWQWRRLLPAGAELARSRRRLRSVPAAGWHRRRWRRSGHRSRSAWLGGRRQRRFLRRYMAYRSKPDPLALCVADRPGCLHRAFQLSIPEIATPAESLPGWSGS